MTDAQIGILASAIAALGAAIATAIRWGVGRITKSADDGTKALVDGAASNAVLVTKLDEFGDNLRGMALAMGALTSKLDRIAEYVDEVSDVHHASPVPRAFRRPATPAKGTMGPPGVNIRARSRGGTEDG